MGTPGKGEGDGETDWECVCVGVGGWHDYTYEGQHADSKQDRRISSDERLSYTFYCEISVKNKPADCMQILTYASCFYQGTVKCPVETSDWNKLWKTKGWDKEGREE